MDAGEFELLRTTLRSLAERHRVATVDELTTATRVSTQEALNDLGLWALRATAPPLATVQECAILAQDMGGYLLGASFLGPMILRPELQRLADCAPATDPGLSTMGLGRDLATIVQGHQPRALGWDAAGSEFALFVRPDGTVWSGELAGSIETADPVRVVREVSDGSEKPVGKLTPDSQRHWHAFVLIMLSSEMVGGARSLLLEATEYAKVREQYGQEIARFQAVQHLLADAHVLVETAASAIQYAAWVLDHDPVSKGSRAAAVAKAYTNEAAVESIRLSMQVFGGIAQTWAHKAHLYLRRSLFDAACAGRNPQLQVELATWEEEQ